MKKQSLSSLLLIVVSAVALSACNSGGTSNVTPSNTQNSPLAEYINLLQYIPAGSNSNLVMGESQQSFNTPGNVTISSIDVNTYDGAECTGSLLSTVNMPSYDGGFTPPAGQYRSTNASNFALCNMFPGECAGYYSSLSGNSSQVSYSMEMVYNIAGGEGYQIKLCLYNPDADAGAGQGTEGLAQWYYNGVNNAPNQTIECNETHCGFSQAYNVNLSPPA